MIPRLNVTIICKDYSPKQLESMIQSSKAKQYTLDHVWMLKSNFHYAVWSRTRVHDTRSTARQRNGNWT